jgi:Ca2+-binding EF-hand superfamily protein
MSDDQLSELRDAFNAMDKDGNGYIEKRELKNLLLALGESPTDKDVDDMFKAADVNGDGQISFEEFAKVVGGL